MTRVGQVLWRILMIFALPLILFATWWVTSADSTNYLLPPLEEILGVMKETWLGTAGFTESRLYNDVIPSILRLLAGFVIAIALGIALGVPIGLRRNLRSFVEPILEFFRAIPPPIMVPVFILIMGFGNNMKIIVIAIGCLWPILLNTVEGVRGIDPVLRDTSRSFRLGRTARLTKLVLPAASPQIITGARQALSIGIILMVISEMFAAKDGLGFTIVQFQRAFAIPQMWSGVLLLGLLGVLLSLVFKWITERLLRWYYGYLQSQRGGA